MTRPHVLYVTDLSYPARGRRYGDEDVWLSDRLRNAFTIALCHPVDAVALMDAADVVVVRNSGPVIAHRAAHDAFRAAALERGTRVYNSLDGRGDMAGKRYLVDLTREGYPVIPTVDRSADVALLPDVPRYVVKPTWGADSIGLEVVDAGALPDVDGDHLIQPLVPFVHEVSFTVVDGELLYAMYAPDPATRWALARWEPTPEDIAFVDRFIEWNTLSAGIQRVDACRTREGQLLLVELEDLNPYLSLELLDEATRDAFVAAMASGVERLLARS